MPKKNWKRHQKLVSTAFRTKVINLSQIAEIWLAEMAIWPPRQIWGIWKWSQVIPHARKHGVWHQNQVSSLPRRKITKIPILRGMIFWIFWFQCLRGGFLHEIRLVWYDFVEISTKSHHSYMTRFKTRYQRRNLLWTVVFVWRKCGRNLKVCEY